MPSLLKEDLLTGVAGTRHGITTPPHVAATTFADIPGIWHVGIPQREPAGRWQSAAGGAGRDVETARRAAIGEALERYAAYVCELPLRRRDELGAGERQLGSEAFALFTEQQVGQPGFSHAALYAHDAPLTNVFSLVDNRETWVPHALVSLAPSDAGAGLATSSGLAAAPSRYGALLRGLQELVERDALMVTWLHGIAGRQVALGARYTDPVAERGGEVVCIDATPAYSPHPVAVVAGQLPQRGVARFSLGAACRATWAQAVEKAYLEWAQGVLFAGYYSAEHPELSFATYEDVATFDHHAVYYTAHPQEWAKVALVRGAPHVREPEPRPLPARVGTVQTLEQLVSALGEHGVRTYYRDLTTPDLRQIGVYVARVLSPDLTPVFCHGRFPFLGGRTSDVAWRYPWATDQPLCFPNPLPHPLG